jgi:hypothetical protein
MASLLDQMPNDLARTSCRSVLHSGLNTKLRGEKSVDIVNPT